MNVDLTHMGHHVCTHTFSMLLRYQYTPNDTQNPMTVKNIFSENVRIGAFEKVYPLK